MNDDLSRGTPSGKLFGVCADLSERSGIAALLIRILAVAALLAAFKLTVVAYCVTAIILRAEARG